ncbi:10619_t:CDS:10 [Ambispora leptoticha]|uniref:10619_t:CDS:1 n=1 Tax=Ambispora leptoticha TaxID=144679 RepID=A0A9N8YS53_9GLOM|nr:10619_t:CDS:10 [Ambispora leptoticha]
MSGSSFCHEKEGWGPASSTRILDLTLCFEEGGIITPINCLLFLFGVYDLYRLSKKRPVIPTDGLWKWHFITISITLFLLLVSSSSIALFTILKLDAQLLDIQVISAAVNVLAAILTSIIEYQNYTRNRIPSTVLLLYWLFYTIANFIRLRTWYYMDYRSTHLGLFVSLTSSIFLMVILFVLELLPKPKSEYEHLGEEESEKACPEETANIFSRLTFYWMTQLMKLGYSKYLTFEDLWDLKKEDQSTVLSRKFEIAWKKELTKKNPSLLWACVTTFGGPFFFAALFKASQDILGFIQPLLLSQLMEFVSSYGTKTEKPHAYKGILIACLMFFTAVFQTILLHQYFQLCIVTGMRLRAGLVTAIYQKALRLSNAARQKSTVGEIVNHMSVDAQKFMDLCTYFHIIWSGPLQICLALIFLYKTMGVSIFAGVAAMILTIPANGFLAKRMRSLQKKQMGNKDQRIKLMNEVLNGIKVIKLYAWEGAFLKKIAHIRDNLELDTLKKIAYLASIQNFTWACTPFLVSFATFSIFVLISDEPLTSGRVFVALSLFNLLQFPLSVFPSVITSTIEASVALNRMENYLLAEEIDQNAVIHEDYHTLENLRTENGDIELVSIKNGTFRWSRNSPEPILNDINLSVSKGKLVAIVGRVGAGKSSLLSAILGEMEKTSGEVIVRGTIAYVAQSAWIMNASLRDNITFGYQFEQEFYDNILEACALKPDIEMLPGGDLTEIGERGINLSGGQKARIGLARAAYCRADIYLFDDPLSAVDARVGKHIFDQVIGPSGILRSKARIFVTHGIHNLSRANSIVMLRDGAVIEQGDFESLMKKKNELFNLISEFGQQDQSDQSDETSSIKSQTLVEAYEIDGADGDPKYEETTRPPRERRFSVVTLNRPVMADVKSRKLGVELGKESLIVREESATGSVPWSVYKAYIKSSSTVAVIVFLLLMIGSQGVQYWSSENEKKGENENILLYLGIYGLIGVIYSLMTIFQTIVLWVFCAIRSARRLHKEMLSGVVRSPMSFFDTTPLGRILNRFSKDQYTIDEVLPRTFSGYFRTFFMVLATISVISFSTPSFILFIVPMRTYYLATSRELKRLDSVTRSPIYAHFQETLGGVTTIRAYQQQDRFIEENEYRLDENQKAYFPSFSCNRWLAVRLEFLGSLIIFGASLLSVITLITTGNIDAGLVGLSVSYALIVTQALNWAVRQFCEIETNIVSVERVKEYIDLPSEAPEIIADNRPPPAWPQQGLIEYKDYATRYRPGLELILKGVSFTVMPKEKIGIVGRTGAGKSSLTLSLFRLIEATDGCIYVDDIDITKIGLYDLRSRLTIIPQDPILFEGTVAFNLDPFGTHDDVEIWQVLQSAHLKEHIAKLDGKLQAKVLEGGDNFSQGQRQLLCLARALLRRSPVIVLDEATASVDVETDSHIQETIRTEFSWATLLCIAHRLRTIIDYDRVLVLEQGKVAEFDTPYKLLQNPDSLFRKLCEESNEYEFLMESATKKHNI